MRGLSPLADLLSLHAGSLREQLLSFGRSLGRDATAALCSMPGSLQLTCGTPIANRCMTMVFELNAGSDAIASRMITGWAARTVRLGKKPSQKPEIIYTDNSKEFIKPCQRNHDPRTLHRYGVAERPVRRVTKRNSYRRVRVCKLCDDLKLWFSRSLLGYSFCFVLPFLCTLPSGRSKNTEMPGRPKKHPRLCSCKVRPATVRAS